MWELADVEFEDSQIDEFELESGIDDRTALQAIADALEAGGQAGYDAAATWVDWTEIVDFIAATAVVGQFDSYPWRSPGDDAHVYFDPADGRMDMIPHGMDETFKRENYDIYSGAGFLLQTCLASEACAADYEASLLEVQATADRIDLLGYAEQVQAQIAPLVEADTARPYAMTEVDDAQALMLDFIATRSEKLTGQMGTP